MKADLLKQFICPTPFAYLEIHKNGVFSCCPSWLPNKIGSIDNIENIWNSKELKEVQDSILDGSYKFCSKTECPYLSSLIKTNGIESKTFVEKSKFNKLNYKLGPSNINFAFDRSCNLSCPSCRNIAIMANGKEIEFIDDTIDKVIETYGKTMSLLYLSGTADPFASKSIRRLLLNFDRDKMPNVKSIHLHTNALLLTKDMWGKLSHIHDLIKTIEISVDASNKEVYEVVRRGGDWGVLLENLKFISTINLRDKRISFVVQDTNYTQMEDFYTLMSSIFNNKADIYFNKITNWGTYTDSEFEKKQIWNSNHPDFNLFLIELNKIDNKYNCNHNMHDIVDKYIIKKLTKLV
jgi:MoaA/NifB/PqqE/SkfB family radical SAM enzyme